jgi:hypothetical protein
MNPTVDIEFIADKIATDECIYWKISPNDTFRSIHSRNDDAIDPETSANLFMDSVSSIRNGLMHVEISKRSKKEIAESKDNYTGIFKYVINCNTRSRTSSNQSNVNASGSVVPLSDYLIAMNEIHALKLDVFKLTNELQDSNNSGASMLTPILMEMAKSPVVISKLGSLFGESNQSHVSKPSGFDTWDDSDKINDAITRLKQHDPDLAQTICDMANAVDKQPAILPAFKEQIKTFL